MEQLIIPITECIVFSLAAGMVFGIFGSGSGLIMTPGFYYILRHFHWASSHQMQMAIATTALSSAVLGLFSARVQIKQHNMSISAVRQMAPGLLIGTIIAISVATLIPSTILKHAFGLVVILVSVWLWRYQPEHDSKSWSLYGAGNLSRSCMIGIIWFLLGVAVFLAPYLLKCKVAMRQAVGSASVLAALFSLIGGIMFMVVGIHILGISWLNLGYVHNLIFCCAIIPGAVGGAIGAHISIRLPQTYLKQTYAGLVCIVGLLMLI